MYDSHQHARLKVAAQKARAEAERTYQELLKYEEKHAYKIEERVGGTFTGRISCK